MKKIENVCDDCVIKRDAHQPSGSVISYWEDKCDLCGKTKMVTSVFDYGWDVKKLIENK